MAFSFKQLFSLLLITFCGLLAATALQAWTGPTATAPNGNVAAPINVGTVDQVKNAGLSLNALTVFGSQYVQNKLGVNQVSPVVALDVGGSVKLGNGGETCTSSIAGAIRYLSASSALQYCDGMNWRGFSGVDTSIATGTQSYTTAGNYTFTVPSAFNTLTVVVRGGGGGAGGGSYPRGPTGATGGTSSFASTVYATGGLGGNPGGCGAVASPGVGSGGDQNYTGGGAIGAVGTGPYCSGRYYYGGTGGEGGLAIKVYTTATLAPGSSVPVVVGVSYGQAASVVISWQ
jgi:hypothetical protein